MVELHQHLIIDASGNLQWESRSFPQSIANENKVREAYDRLLLSDQNRRV